MHRFLFSDVLQEGMEIHLPPDQSKHLSRVLRIQKGEQVEVFNGKGLSATGLVLDSSVRKSKLQINRVEKKERRAHVRLAFALPKSLALDFVIRRLTEIGVEGFQPLQTEYSLSLKAWNASRWEKVLKEVCKQCQEYYLPVLHPPKPLSLWLQERASQRPLVVCHEEEREAKLEGARTSQGIDLLIGAEGGWSPKEKELFVQAEALFLGLGPNRLRTETAALVGTVLVKQHIREYT